jgi:cyclopropane-fatty-acyl-phospholipid synthase
VAAEARAVMSAADLVTRLVDAGVVPDVLIRAGIRRVLAARLAAIQRSSTGDRLADRTRFADERSRGPIAVETKAANAQHYEVPTGFYRRVLGRHLKYSSGWWGPEVDTLDEAEAAMLERYGERAALADGQRVLELGCGWGSLALWMARRFPSSEIVAVSNSRTQKEWIDGEAARDRLANLRVITADMNTFEAPGTFDRIVSVEMFEHMRNWRALFERVARWLEPDGAMFLHIFTHRTASYTYESEGPTDWMAEYFFTGGIMPSADLVDAFADILTVDAEWTVNGTHYQKTAEAWLANMDRRRAEILPLFADTYGDSHARIWWARWRVFFMACAELWGYRGGTEWQVSHYRLSKRPGLRTPHGDAVS